MSVLLKPLEIALNAAIKQDPETAQRLIEFNQRRVQLNIEDLHLKVEVWVEAGEIKLGFVEQDNQTADLTISSDAFSLLKLGQHPDNLFSPEIKIHGDVQFAKQIQDLLDGFDFDWEGQLARVTGDTLAQPISYGIKQGFSWLKSTHHSLETAMSEYLREESRILPHQIEVEDYLSAVDKLRADLDRLEARINRLGSHQ